jgi:hypothetical protein
VRLYLPALLQQKKYYSMPLAPKQAPQALPIVPACRAYCILCVQGNSCQIDVLGKLLLNHASCAKEAPATKHYGCLPVESASQHVAS